MAMHRIMTKDNRPYLVPDCKEVWAINNNYKHMRMLDDEELLLVRSGAIEDALPMAQVHDLLDEMRKSRRLVSTASMDAYVATIVAAARDVQDEINSHYSQDDPCVIEIQTPITTKAKGKRASKRV